MGQKINVTMTLPCTAIGAIELPDGLDWEKDVKSWHVKWGTVYIETTNGDCIELDADSDIADGIDWKNPSWVEFHAIGEDGETDYSKTLDEG